MAQYDFAVIGGDERIACMMPLLEEKGYSMICYGTREEKKRKGLAGAAVVKAASLRQAIENADAVIGGIPMIKKQRLECVSDLPDISEEEFFTCLKEGQKLFAGLLSEGFLQCCREQGVSCYDFMAEETLAVYNSIATSEGAVMEAMKNKDTNIHGSLSLVLGYGRCGRVLCDKLKGLSAKVTVSSIRNEELSCAEAFGLRTIFLPCLKEEINRFEYVFNTIPSLVLTSDLLEKMDKNVIIIDIASLPGGVDHKAAEKMGIHSMHCLGIPGKYAPRTSAGYLAQYVDKMMQMN